jgi:hypothetical protein
MLNNIELRMYNLKHLIQHRRQYGNTHTLALGCIEAAKTRKETPLLVVHSREMADHIRTSYDRKVDAVTLDILPNRLVGSTNTFVLDNWTVYELIHDMDLYLEFLLREYNSKKDRNFLK